MARRRMIVHGSQEEMEMFEPIYNTRLRLQHGASSSRFQLPDPPTDVQSLEQEGEDVEGAVVTSNFQTADREGNYGVTVETPCWRSSTDNDENASCLADKIPHSPTRTEDQVGFENNSNTELQAPGIG